MMQRAINFQQNPFTFDSQPNNILFELPIKSHTFDDVVNHPTEAENDSQTSNHRNCTVTYQISTAPAISSATRFIGQQK